MDLAVEAQLLRLDLLAVGACRALAAAEVPHVLLKGPSTRLWLHDRAHTYRDVDILVPYSALGRARTALRDAGVATASAGRAGEEAEHSQLLISGEGFEVDLHFSLPSVPPDGDRPWEVLAAHVLDLDLGVGTVPALDEPARCLVLAVHALNSGMADPPGADLRRALALAPERTWSAARALATRMGAAALLSDALALARGEAAHSTRGVLLATGAPSAALGLERLRAASRSRLPLLLWREALPSRGFMRVAYPDLTALPLGLVRAHLRRWSRLRREAIPAWRAWRRARAGG